MAALVVTSLLALAAVAVAAWLHGARTGALSAFDAIADHCDAPTRLAIHAQLAPVSKAWSNRDKKLREKLDAARKAQRVAHNRVRSLEADLGIGDDS